MLSRTKISIGLGCFFIITSHFCTVSASNEGSVKNSPIYSPYFSALHVVIDSITGHFIASNEDGMVEKRQNIMSGSEHVVYSKQRSVIDGGGIILTMGNDSFSQMRVIKNKEGITHTQCSVTK